MSGRMTGLSAEECQDTRDRVKRMKVAELKDLCKSMGFKLTGKKSDLIQRITDYFEQGIQIQDVPRLLAMRTLVLKRDCGSVLPAYRDLYMAIESGQYSVASNNQYTQKLSASQLYSRDSQPYRGWNLYFKTNPFFKLKRSIHGSPQILNPTKSKDNCEFRFILNSEENALLNMNDDSIKVYLLCGRLQDNAVAASTDVAIEFPSPIEIQANNNVIAQNYKGIKGKTGTAKPADITKFIKPHPHSNKVNILFYQTQDTYLAYIYIVQTVSCDVLIKEVLNKPHIHKNSTIRKIQSQNEDDDIVVSTASVTLRDPLSYTRMKYPVQSIYCKHTQCFDGLIFLHSQLQIPTWICPYCQIPIDIDELAISDYFLDILNLVPEEVDQVIINEDGSWEADNTTASKEATPKTSEDKVNTSALQAEIEIISLSSDSEDETEPSTNNHRNNNQVQTLIELDSPPASIDPEPQVPTTNSQAELQSGLKPDQQTSSNVNTTTSQVTPKPVVTVTNEDIEETIRSAIPSSTTSPQSATSVQSRGTFETMTTTSLKSQPTPIVQTSQKPAVPPRPPPSIFIPSRNKRPAPSASIAKTAANQREFRGASNQVHPVNTLPNINTINNGSFTFENPSSVASNVGYLNSPLTPQNMNQTLPRIESMLNTPSALSVRGAHNNRDLANSNIESDEDVPLARINRKNIEASVPQPIIHDLTNDQPIQQDTPQPRDQVSNILQQEPLAAIEEPAIVQAEIPANVPILPEINHRPEIANTQYNLQKDGHIDHIIRNTIGSGASSPNFQQTNSSQTQPSLPVLDFNNHKVAKNQHDNQAKGSNRQIAYDQLHLAVKAQFESKVAEIERHFAAQRAKLNPQQRNVYDNNYPEELRRQLEAQDLQRDQNYSRQLEILHKAKSAQIASARKKYITILQQNIERIENQQAQNSQSQPNPSPNLSSSPPILTRSTSSPQFPGYSNNNVVSQRRYSNNNHSFEPGSQYGNSAVDRNLLLRDNTSNVYSDLPNITNSNTTSSQLPSNQMFPASNDFANSEVPNVATEQDRPGLQYTKSAFELLREMVSGNVAKRQKVKGLLGIELAGDSIGMNPDNTIPVSNEIPGQAKTNAVSGIPETVTGDNLERDPSNLNQQLNVNEFDSGIANLNHPQAPSLLPPLPPPPPPTADS